MAFLDAKVALMSDLWNLRDRIGALMDEVVNERPGADALTLELVGHLERGAAAIRSKATSAIGSGYHEGQRCPCCAGSGRKRFETYLGAGRYRDDGVKACPRCEGSGEVSR